MGIMLPISWGRFRQINIDLREKEQQCQRLLQIRYGCKFSGLDPDRPAELETGGGVGSSVGNTKRDDVCKELSNRMGTHEFLVTMTIDDDDDDDTPHRKRKCFCLMSS